MKQKEWNDILAVYKLVKRSQMNKVDLKLNKGSAKVRSEGEKVIIEIDEKE